MLRQKRNRHKPLPDSDHCLSYAKTGLLRRSEGSGKPFTHTSVNVPTNRINRGRAKGTETFSDKHPFRPDTTVLNPQQAGASTLSPFNLSDRTRLIASRGYADNA